jgi:hypothetical protein
MRSKFTLFFLGIFVVVTLQGQMPNLNSNPGITNKVIFLDFDGQVVKGTSWNNGNTINAAPSTLSQANKINVWKRLSEDYRPFDINITTDSVRFNNAPPNKRMRVIVTPTSAWYGSAGGVAFLGSFTWGGTPGTPCWVFENQLSYSTKNISEAAAHEVGHTLSLYHQSTYNASCVKTNEYHPGTGGTGVTSWGPIMGASYSRNVTIWHTGTSSNGCTVIQNDHSSSFTGLTGTPYLAFLPDDIGNTFNTAKILNLNTVNLSDSGIITTPADVDVYRFTICNNRYISVNAKPWALDTVNYGGANLDIKLKLFNAAGALIAGDSNLTRLRALVGANLTPGSYYFTIKGDISAYHDDYGSLGKYYISVKATNPPQLNNTILTGTNVCAGQNISLSYSSNGVPNSWQWDITGPNTSSYSTQNPTVNFNPAGVYTITLLATSSNSLSCPVTKTIDAGAIPGVTVTGLPFVCQPKNTTLTAIGATSYTWLPANFNGSVQILNPSSNSTFTVVGANGNCNSSAVVTVNVIPPFSINVTASGSQICPGQTVSATASGANSYVWMPGNLNGSAQALTPTSNTTYTITGSNGSCNSNATIAVNVSQINLNVNVSNAALCAGQSVTLSASGAASYTVNPGGVTSNPSVFTPSANTTFFITGENGSCSKTTSTQITVEPDFQILLSVSDSLLCLGDTAYITAFGANSFTFSPGANGGGSWVVAPQVPTSYTLTAANNDNCPKDTVIFINVKTCDKVGIGKLKIISEVLIYPNPASGEFSVVQSKGISKIEIFNAMAALIYKENYTNTSKIKIDAKDWSTGVYFIKVYSGEQALSVHKIVIQ